MGERPLIRYCESLGQVKVKNIPRVKAGEISIELNIVADEDEKLTITAIESKNKKNLPVEFEFNEVYVSKGVQMLIDAV
jgi:molecular chaperone DnaK (HSP70)